MAAPPRIPAALALDGLPGDARAAFDLAAAAGYNAVAVPTNHPELAPDILGPSARRHLKQTLAARQLHVAALRVAAPRAGLTDPATIDRTVANVRKALELAPTLGVNTVALAAGPLADAKLPESTIVTALRELAEQADRHGVMLALTADIPAKLRGLLDQVGFDQARINYAPAQVIAAGADPLQTLETLAGRIAQLTAADAIKAGRQLRAAELGAGQVPWRELFELLRAQDFRGPTVVDVRDLPSAPDAATHAAAVLRKLLT